MKTMYRLHETDPVELKEAYERDGFVFLEQAFDMKRIDAFEALVKGWAGEICKKNGFDTNGKSFFDILKIIEEKDKSAFYQLCVFSGTSVAGFRIATDPAIMEAMQIVSGQSPDRLFNANLNTFYNSPSVTRLHYGWHQESTYQTDYKTAFHIWFPLFRDLGDEDGPMVVKRGAYHNTFPYKYSKEEKGLTQMCIEEKDIEDYESVICSMKRGDVILFHHALVHASGTNLNKEGLPRISGGVRYFDALAEKEFSPVLAYYSKVVDVKSEEKAREHTSEVEEVTW